MNITKQQHKILLIRLAIVVGSYVVRAIVTAAMQMAYYQQQAIRAAPRREAKAKAVAPIATAPSNAASSATSPPPSAAPIAPAPFGNLSGIWRGRAALEGLGICDLRFELREKEPGQFSGYSRFSRINVPTLMSPKDSTNARSVILNHMNPVSAILTGTLENGAIHFHVDKTIGTDINGCFVTFFTLTPFGTNQLAAEWESTWRSGHIILQKARP